VRPAVFLSPAKGADLASQRRGTAKPQVPSHTKPRPSGRDLELAGTEKFAVFDAASSITKIQILALTMPGRGGIAREIRFNLFTLRDT